MDKLKLSPANLTILVAGVAMLIGSLLNFSTFKLGGTLLGGQTVRASWTAWSSHYFLIATLPAILGIVMAVQVAVAGFASGVKVPETLLGLTWNQIHLVLGFQATIMMLAFLIQDTGELHKGLGLFVMLVAAIALLVGAILRMQERPSGA
jgi:hypothetical protein